MQINANISLKEFISKKTRSLLKPYFLLFFLPNLLIIGLIKPNFGTEQFQFTWVQFALMSLEYIFHSAYWFVPALFLTLVLNFLVPTNRLKQWTIISFVFWIISYLNIYWQIATSAHTIWIIAFFLIFNFGRYFYIYKDKIISKSLFNSYSFIIPMLSFGLVLSCVESLIIFYRFGSSDFGNTFRIGNIIYSVMVFFLANKLFSLRTIPVLKGFSFYFMYLIHPFVLDAFGHIIRFLGIPVLTYPTQLFFNLFVFLILILMLLFSQLIFNKIKFRGRFVSEMIFKHK